MSSKTKSILTHVGIILFFLVVACVYFSPILEGKALPQGDLQKYEGMAKAQKDFHKATGDYSNWAPNMFSGMPGYQITRSPQHSIFTPLGNIATLRFADRANDIGVLFLYLVGFYIALIALGLNGWLALIGALAFGLGSYNIIIIEAGHITKAHAMAMMAPILAGMILTFRKNYLWGGILFTLALGLQIALNHIQITFYTVIGALTLGIVYFIYAVKDKEFKSFLTGVGVLVLGAGLAFGSNMTHLLVNEEYAKYTMRGGKEISVTPKDLDPNAQIADDGTTTKGLDINYAFSWSYGVGETYTLLVPGAIGGGSMEKVDKESEWYKNTRMEQAPLYWGTQPFTSGPVYFGAIIIFLFVLGMLIVEGPDRWWILIATLLAIIMSWGRNAMGINGWLFEHLPLYNKFRTPSMALVLANVTMVLMAMLALKALFNNVNKENLKKLNRSLYIATGVVVVVLLGGMIMAGNLSFTGGNNDAQMAQQYGDQWNMIQTMLQKDRKALFMSDTWRSLILVVAAAALLWLYINEKIKKSGIVIATLAALVVIDLWGVDTRYLNKDNFTSESKIRMVAAQYDIDIDQQAAAHGDNEYRVMNLAVDTYNNSTPSAFHQQIGGYSAAKLRRYQDLIDFYLGQNAVINHYYKTQSFDNYPVLDMLNCRYLVLPTQGGNQVVRRNSALGNAWFVNKAQLVEDANGEILALNDFNPATTAIMNKEYSDEVSAFAHNSDSTLASGTIILDNQSNLNLRKYNSHSDKEQIAVFSEIYYAPDWKAYLDGQPVEYMRANYVLRSMVVPAGDHVIEFRNESPTMHKLNTWTLIFSIITVLAIAGAIFLYYRKEKKQQ